MPGKCVFWNCTTTLCYVYAFTQLQSVSIMVIFSQKSYVRQVNDRLMQSLLLWREIVRMCVWGGISSPSHNQHPQIFSWHDGFCWPICRLSVSLQSEFLSLFGSHPLFFKRISHCDWHACLMSQCSVLFLPSPSSWQRLLLFCVSEDEPLRLTCQRKQLEEEVDPGWVSSPWSNSHGEVTAMGAGS